MAGMKPRSIPQAPRHQSPDRSSHRYKTPAQTGPEKTRGQTLVLAPWLSGIGARSIWLKGFSRNPHRSPEMPHENHNSRTATNDRLEQHAASTRVQICKCQYCRHYKSPAGFRCLIGSSSCTQLQASGRKHCSIVWVSPNLSDSRDSGIPVITIPLSIQSPSRRKQP